MTCSEGVCPMIGSPGSRWWDRVGIAKGLLRRNTYGGKKERKRKQNWEKEVIKLWYGPDKTRNKWYHHLARSLAEEPKRVCHRILLKKQFHEIDKDGSHIMGAIRRQWSEEGTATINLRFVMFIITLGVYCVFRFSFGVECTKLNDLIFLSSVTVFSLTVA